MPNVDATVISFQCPKCGQDLQQTIGLLKSNQRLVCKAGFLVGRQPAVGVDRLDLHGQRVVVENRDIVADGTGSSSASCRVRVSARRFSSALSTPA